MDIFQRAVCGASRLAAQLSAVLLVAMVCHIIVEIVLRSFFATSTFVLDEVVGYGVAAMTFLSLGYALEQGALIRVNVLITRVGGMPRYLLELFCIGVTLAVSGFLVVYIFRGVLRNWNRGAVSESIAEIPLWIPEGLVLVGLALFTVQLFAYGLRVATGGALITGDKAIE